MDDLRFNLVLYHKSDLWQFLGHPSKLFQKYLILVEQSPALRFTPKWDLHY